MGLEGKVALITGAGSGMGREAAVLFAREGARVVVSDVVEAGGNETVAAVQSAGGDATHGSMFHRAPGSIGASSDPSRVWPGHKLPGRMGGDQRTVLNVSVVRVLPEQNLVLLHGAVPGANGSLVMLRKSIKTTKQQQQKAADKK